MNTALVHYWLVNMRGGEKVLQAFGELYPEAPIYTHTFDRGALSPDLAARDIRTTFIQRLPLAKRRYQQYLPLMPLALEQLDLRGFQLVISSESGPAKGVIVGPNTTHICYCHSPMRYIWDMYHDYYIEASRFTRFMMPLLCHYLRMWDLASSQRVDHFVANSRFVAERIRKCYGKSSTIINPPVNVDQFSPKSEKGDYYLFFGELVGYKRADLAIEAFRESGRKLVVAGKGALLDSLKKTAPSNVHFTGSLPFAGVRELLSNARALIFPGVEDFGIIPVEAMASGTPVIGYARGGILDSVISGETGVLFDAQTPQALNEAVSRFELGIAGITTGNLRRQAIKFSPEIFKQNFSAVAKREVENQRARLIGSTNDSNSDH